MTPEQWHQIPGLVGYEVSSFTRVRSLDRQVGYTWKGRRIERLHNGRLLKLHTYNYGKAVRIHGQMFAVRALLEAVTL